MLLAAFVVIERRTTHPLVPLRITADRTRATSYFVMLIVGAALFAMFYFLGIYVQNTLGYSSLRAGLAFLPFSVGIVISAQVASALMSRMARGGRPAPEPRWRPSACGDSRASTHRARMPLTSSPGSSPWRSGWVSSSCRSP
ncbi:MAG TPA: hypothetical protein VJN29_06530 [Intrasporangium sp.]|uniref:hypothetical protein n=1 Tax=Intrasporangium sp. TaxID=1925024 RepID=UPI002B47E71A|nr:hypothetical protein [Intrasporangium sp.]HKX66861.1 hypothetical protein [Intrasporangium sp.]